MKTLGIVRNLDALGRVTLPKELRKTFGIKEGDPVEIYTDNGAICLKPAGQANCEFCGNTDTNKLVELAGKHICHNCITTLIEEA